MATNRTSKTTGPRKNWLTPVWNSLWDFLFAPVLKFFTQPHPSVKNVGEIRRAQLLATITLILVASFTWAVLFNPTAISTFIALYITTLTAYVLSRTRYYRAGTYFFSYGIT